MDTSTFVADDYGWAMIIGFPFFVFFSLKFIGKSKVGKRVIDTVKLKIPIMDALNITRDTVGNVVFENALQKVHDAIREGESFAGPLRQAKVCDTLVTNMIDVGEETGDLDKMLMKIADNY